MFDIRNPLHLSILTLVLIAFAVLIFIYTGGSYLFYFVGVVAFVVGIVNFWIISEEKRAADAYTSSLFAAKKPKSRKKRR